jgi:hypothetical protein
MLPVFYKFTEYPVIKLKCDYYPNFKLKESSNFAGFSNVFLKI